MKKMIYFVVVICLTFGLLMGNGFFSEAEEVQKAGCLTVSFENHPEYEAMFRVYEAAKLENGRYVLKEDFEELADRVDFNKDFTSPEKLNQMEIREIKEIIEQLSAHVREKGIAPDAELLVKGTSSLALEEDGIYLLIPVENDRLEIEAFLAQVPAWEEKTEEGKLIYVWSRNVEAYPKLIPKEAETETPEETKETEAPGETEVTEGGSERGASPKEEKGGFLPGIGTGDESGARMIGYAVLAAAMLLILLYEVLKHTRKRKKEL